jgi:hypothetical protein
LNHPNARTIFERLALHVFHDEKGDAVLLAHVEQRADVWMIQRGDESRLVLKTLAAVDARAEFLGQKFDRDRTVQTSIAGAIDLAHAASAEDRDDFVRTKSGTWTDH